MTRPLTNAEENPHAGRGSSVLLDIGDDIGAIVVTAPAELYDAEIVRRPAGEHRHGHFPHVGVVQRSAPDGHTIHSAVFFDVPEGRYDLAVLPDGPVRLTVNVSGGRVTEVSW
ncbi:hypothetical protein AB0E63_31755 [Kribbella sp. NPDC026596]|uniref:hypothetical protein n=1 Tax=Kribbella sp. NPDC026596 TaxID=3155122 RepID=UPI00340641D8